MATLKNRFTELLKERYGEVLPSQTEIAEDLGLSQTTVSRWMGQKVDRFDSEILEKICRELNCNVGDLLSFDFAERESA